MNIIVRLAAVADLRDAFNWYETQRPGLGDEFLTAIDDVMVSIAESPKRYRVALLDIRRALVRRFPYGVFFRVVDEQVVVVACFHAKRDPRRWSSRR